MKKIYTILLLNSLLFLTGMSAQNLSPQSRKAGKCVSYSVKQNTVTFTCENNGKLFLKVCGQGVIKCWYDPTGAFQRNNESFAIINESVDNISSLDFKEESRNYEIYTDKLRIRVNKDPLQVQIFDKYQKLLFSDYKEFGYISDSTKVTTYKTLHPDEQFFGLGEKTGPFNRRGRSYKMWNSDKPCYGVNEDPLYKSIPFFLSNYQYGVFFDNTYKTEYKFGAESEEYFTFQSPAGAFVYYFIYGNDYKQILEQYFALTGKPIMPPKWAFGFSQCRGMLTNEPLTREIANGYRSRKIPCDIIYQDIGWTDGLQDFEWRKGSYQNPAKMIKDLSDMGFKVIVSQDPVISQATTRQWREADSLHYLTTDIRTGKSYDMPWPWGGNCGVVDFTKPEVADWWGSYQQKPLNDGVKGFWTDMGEPAWSNEDAYDRLYMRHHLGMHDEIHNVYGFTWDKVVKEQFEKRNPNRRIFQMTRSAYAGLHRYTFGWSGDSGNGNDVLEGWRQFANQIPIALSAGLGGVPFWTTDISGYCGDIRDYPAMSELYTRWLQFGVFNTLSRAHHEGNVAVEPWLFGEEAEKNCKKAIELKYRLFPYIYTYAREAHDKGWPVLRPLVFEYPNDEETYQLNEQFMFGRELLVAPVVKRGAKSKKVYLPEGEWIDFSNPKKVFEGDQWITYPAPLAVTPVFVKKGSIVPMMPVMNFIGEVQNYTISYHIFPAEEGKRTSFTLYEDDGETQGYLKDAFAKTAVTCATKKEGCEVEIADRMEQNYRPSDSRNVSIKIYLSAKPKAITVNQSKARFIAGSKWQDESPTGKTQAEWSWDEATGMCVIKTTDRGKKISFSIRK